MEINKDKIKKLQNEVICILWGFQGILKSYIMTLLII